MKEIETTDAAQKHRLWRTRLVGHRSTESDSVLGRSKAYSSRKCASESAKCLALLFLRLLSLASHTYIVVARSGSLALWLSGAFVSE